MRVQVAVNMTYEMTHTFSSPHISVFFHPGVDTYDFTASLKEALQANMDDPLLHLIAIDMGNRREGPWHNDMQNASEMMLGILRQAPYATLITASDCWANSGSFNNSVRDLNMQFQQNMALQMGITVVDASTRIRGLGWNDFHDWIGHLACTRPDRNGGTQSCMRYATSGNAGCQLPWPASKARNSKRHAGTRTG